MGFIRNAADVQKDIKETTRWVTVIPASAALELEAVEFEIKFVSDAKLISLAQPHAPKGKRKDNEEVDLVRESKVRRDILKAAVCNWRGVRNGNVRRLSDFFLEHPEMLDSAADKDQWEFSREDVGIIGEHMNSAIFQDLLAELQDLNEFARTRLEQEKKD